MEPDFTTITAAYLVDQAIQAQDFIAAIFNGGAPINAAPTIHHGNCIDVMRAMRNSSVDFALTDPPYITRYRDRDGRRPIANDDNGTWLDDSFAQLHRVLKRNAFAVSFYGWPKMTSSPRPGTRRAFASAGTSSSASDTPPSGRCCPTATNRPSCS